MKSKEPGNQVHAKALEQSESFSFNLSLYNRDKCYHLGDVFWAIIITYKVSSVSQYCCVIVPVWKRLNRNTCFLLHILFLNNISPLRFF